jgi:PAS domain-containing protein
VTNERSRILFALTDRELAEVRRTGVVVTASLLLTLATGLLLVVRPAARALERLVAELLASRAQLEAATAEATRGREFAASLVASAADAIYAFDAVLRITEWNPAMERGPASRADALGRPRVRGRARLGRRGRPYARALHGRPPPSPRSRGVRRPGEPPRYST